MKLQTPVDTGRLARGFGYADRILFLGSCFADNVGSCCSDIFLDTLVNPFGVLYNPLSVADSLNILEGDGLFSPADVLSTPVGFCSLHHHTSFARPSVSEFIGNANAALAAARDFHKRAGWTVVTFGTSFVYRHIASGTVAANCLKLPRQEFERLMLTPEQVFEALAPHVGADTSRQWIFTVSPIRHVADGMHANQASKSVLHLGVDTIVKTFPNAHYFPAYEIVMDELRDYRFYADDMVHPSLQTVRYVFERFMDYALDSNETERYGQAVQLSRMKHHTPLFPGSQQADEFGRKLEESVSQFLSSLGRV